MMGTYASVAAQKLAAYVVMRPGFRFVECARHTHVGALLADGALQAGLNYRSVVFPRVDRIEREFPSASSISGLRKVLDTMPVSFFLEWTHYEKIARFESLVDFFSTRAETVSDIAEYLARDGAQAELKLLKGIGDKTVDYLFRLSGGAGVAVDRHVIRFVEEAGIRHESYSATKHIVNSTADVLGIPRDCFDASIWLFMSTASRSGSSYKQAASAIA